MFDLYLRNYLSSNTKNDERAKFLSHTVHIHNLHNPTCIINEQILLFLRHSSIANTYNCYQSSDIRLLFPNPTIVLPVALIECIVLSALFAYVVCVASPLRRRLCWTGCEGCPSRLIIQFSLGFVACIFKCSVETFYRLRQTKINSIEEYLNFLNK